ncbi:hypothetical protein O181_013180 [Austropuccinia psidii MF-1]|uniref:SNF2 N-terminal domain-containing protein n=1 Tax=Austropuccinia psidii MF-1 TaxID=1389203 RepID=A0A9Q3BYI6_9BASI|nr:hypothetical protein [Austropuccinia psidii MF-1]
MQYALKSFDQYHVGVNVPISYPPEIHVNCPISLHLTQISKKYYSPPLLIDESLDIASGCYFQPLYPPTFIIKTKLLYQQAQGLSFLIDRESPSSVLAIAFWKRISSTSIILWKHKITNKTIITSNSDFHPPSPLRSILSDDMGLGKLLQAISLVSHTLNSARNYQRSSLSTISGCQATIIVCPKRLIKNWEEEINKHTHPNNLHAL